MKTALALLITFLICAGADSHSRKVSYMVIVGCPALEERILDRALAALHQRRYSVAGVLFQTLLNTYPDSVSDSKVQAALSECSHDSECEWEWEHEKNCPPDGCMIFFPSTLK